ncbi:cell wall-binding repeat-containing protein [Leifsonia sp. NPDC056665]|uniref:cell wall-binding repeat-containing protein n=1 Tax=Leifsonia sp. NPDC056665 TaxID=3345901 RepID=UPI0036B2F335
MTAQEAYAQSAPSVTRLAGSDRYETAVAIAQSGYPSGAPVVYVAAGTNYPDALGAGPAAAKLGGPLLLTAPGGLPSEVSSEISALKPSKVVIVGGSNAISPVVQTQLEAAAPTASITRIAGIDRYDTARQIVAAAFPSAQKVYIATGQNYPDALSASAAAGAGGVPVVLVNGDADTLDSASLSLLITLGTQKATIVGGLNAVSAGLASSLTNLLGASNVNRLAGADRFATSHLIAQAAFTSSTSAFLATGYQFPDALAGAALAGSNHAPLFTVPPGCVPSATLADIATLGVSRVTLLGGVNVLSDNIASLTSCDPETSPLPFSSTPTPTISGTAAYGNTLTAVPGSWAPQAATFAYQWYTNGIALGGATSPTYTVSSINIGQTLSVAVTGSAPGYISATVSSAPTAAIATPTVTGTVAATTQRMSASNLDSTQIGWYQAGTVLTLICYQRGQSVQGYFSSSFASGWDNLWYRISDGSYAADVDIETGTLDPVVPACADQPVADTTNATVMATTQRMSSATLNSTQNGVYTAGSRLTLSCYVTGQAVKGYFSGSFPGGYDSLWYQVSDGYWVADVDIQTGSNNPVTPACAAPPPPPTVSSDEITRAKSWIDAKVPYNQRLSYSNQYGTYREDCSGFVSMALGLPSSYTTVTLPQVMHPISKDQLQPGDFMLNSAAGDNGHVAIFMGWTDASHTKYTSWEENGAQGYTFIQVVPYPYWPSWSGASNYSPYRRN